MKVITEGKLMTKKHPLTMDIIFHEFWDCEPPSRKNRFGTNFSYLFFEEGCQMSYDKGSKDMLERVGKWLDENLSNYTDDDYLGDCEPLHKLEGDLKKAMRPTREDN